MIIYVFLRLFPLLTQVEKASGGGSVRGRGRRRQWRRGRRGRSRGHRRWRARTRTRTRSRAGARVLLQTEHVRFGLLLPRQLLAPHRLTVTIAGSSGCCSVCAVPIDTFSPLSSVVARSGGNTQQGDWTHGRTQNGSHHFPSFFFFCSILPVRHEWSRFPESPRLLYPSALE